jgi:hypothetical protein
MKTLLAIGALGAVLATTVPAAADHASGGMADPAVESALDLDLKLGPHGFRLGGRVLGREGHAGGAWLNGEMRSDGFSLDGRVEHDGKVRTFKFNATIDEWLQRAIRWAVTDL